VQIPVQVRPLAPGDSITARTALPRLRAAGPTMTFAGFRNDCAAVLAVVAWLGIAAPATAQELDARLGESVVMVPAGGFTEPELEVTVYRPPGAGPFPVLVINHGRANGNAKFQPRYRPALAAREFVQRGWAVVVPMRQGFSQSGGYEISGGCNVHSNGLQQARSVRRALDWVAQQPWADVSHNVVLGQSHGGLTTLAYGTEPHPGTRLLVNFAGGLRQENCPAWQQNLIRAFGDYGADTRLPSLWFYGDNDSYFQPFVWRGAHERYIQAGGRAELVALGVFGNDAHGLFGSRAGLPIWLPRVLAALDAAGLPTQVVHALPEVADIAAPPPSGFAVVADLAPVPLRTDRARAGYQAWLAADSPKAFAVHPTLGSWASAWGGERPITRALANCERFAKAACRLYAVDDTVVWTIE
jgi:dienelactone hydrolase